MTAADRPERAGSILGVSGRFSPTLCSPAGLVMSQKWNSEARPIAGYGEGAEITAHVRYDDECRNGRETFAVTATVMDSNRRGRDSIACGRLHDDILAVFPELSPLLKWHLCSSNGPIHYIENTCYLAGNRDHNGLLAGERRQIVNGKTGQLCWKLAVADGTPIYQLERDAEGATPPTAVPVLAWLPWERVGEGKSRQLDAARDAAIWLDATDAELMQPRGQLAAALIARLPGLLAEFREVVESCGFIWSGAA